MSEVEVAEVMHQPVSSSSLVIDAVGIVSAQSHHRMPSQLTLQFCDLVNGPATTCFPHAIRLLDGAQALCSALGIRLGKPCLFVQLALKVRKHVFALL